MLFMFVSNYYFSEPLKFYIKKEENVNGSRVYLKKK